MRFLAWALLVCGVHLAAGDALPGSAGSKPKWLTGHMHHVSMARQAAGRGGDLDVLWLGDSITRRLRDRHPSFVRSEFGHLKTLFLGIDGDLTKNLLYRVADGEVHGLRPVVTVILIGTNDLAPVLHLKTPDIQPLLRQTAQGCIHVLQEVAARLPETKLMVVAIMPRGWSQLRGERWKNNATDWRQPSVFTEVLDRTNQNVKKYIDGSKRMSGATFVDCGAEFLTEGGSSLRRDLLPDALHPSLKGYEVLMQCLWPELARHGVRPPA